MDLENYEIPILCRRGTRNYAGVVKSTTVVCVAMHCRWRGKGDYTVTMKRTKSGADATFQRWRQESNTNVSRTEGLLSTPWHNHSKGEGSQFEVDQFDIDRRGGTINEGIQDIDSGHLCLGINAEDIRREPSYSMDIATCAEESFRRPLKCRHL